MLLISHLRAPHGIWRSHTRKEPVQPNQLRGSKAISQISDAVIALQRDQLDEDDSNVSTVWVPLKNRHCGVIGKADVLEYIPKTGRMVTIEEASNDDCPF